MFSRALRLLISCAPAAVGDLMVLAFQTTSLASQPWSSIPSAGTRPLSNRSIWRVVGRLKSIPQGEGSLLDSTVLAMGSGISDGDKHDHGNLAVLLAGGALRPGHFHYDDRRPLADLWLSLARHGGVKRQRFAERTALFASWWRNASGPPAVEGDLPLAQGGDVLKIDSRTHGTTLRLWSTGSSYLCPIRFCLPMTFRLLALIACAELWSAGVAWAVDPVTQFEHEVRPLLEQRCYECHGPEKQKGGLRLDQKASVLGAGDSESPAVIPGNHAGSEVTKRILSTDPDETMPPKGKRLTGEEIASIKQWIDLGAHWPQTREPERELAPAPPGKTITAGDRDFWAFQRPHRATAGQTEPWSRQPLDGFILARMRERGFAPAEESSRETFIRRLSFDITGLPPTPEEVAVFCADQSKEAHAALVDRLLASPRFGERLASMWLPLARYAEDQAHQVGDDTKFFYGNAHLYRAWVIDAFNRDLPYDQFLKLQLAADLVPSSATADLAALGFLGLGPKYYNRNRLEVMADEWEDRVDTVSRTMLGLTVACARCHDHKFDPITAADYHAIAGVFASTRMVNRMPDGTPEKENTKANQIDPGTLHVVEEGDLQNLNVFIRGNVTRKGPVVPRRFLAVLAPDEPAPFRTGSGRAELAEAIASPDNPLTARVLVNRVWGLFFGEPLVSTPSNFGHSGAKPTNPQLLDDLAARFVENGWSIKKLVREITLSATYRQSSQGAAESAQRDPENELLSHMNRRRLSIEQWRDAVLAVSGELTEAPGARSKELDDPANSLRTVYARISRLKLNDLLMQFDYPDANVHAEKRSVTTTPTQKLFLLNSPFVQSRATALASRLQAIETSDEERLVMAYRLLFARAPDERERALGIDFLRQPATADIPQWERYTQLLLVSNEMLYVD